MYYTYMLRCENNSIYTGITKDMKRRFNEHVSKDKLAANYTKVNNVIEVLVLWESKDRSIASKLEYHIKKLSKDKKELLVKTKDIKSIFKNNNKINYLDYKLCAKF